MTERERSDGASDRGGCRGPIQWTSLAVSGACRSDSTGHPAFPRRAHPGRRARARRANGEVVVSAGVDRDVAPRCFRFRSSSSTWRRCGGIGAAATAASEEPGVGRVSVDVIAKRATIAPCGRWPSCCAARSVRRRCWPGLPVRSRIASGASRSLRDASDAVLGRQPVDRRARFDGDVDRCRVSSRGRPRRSRVSETRHRAAFRRP